MDHEKLGDFDFEFWFLISDDGQLFPSLYFDTFSKSI